MIFDLLIPLVTLEGSKAGTTPKPWQVNPGEAPAMGMMSLQAALRGMPHAASQKALKTPPELHPSAGRATPPLNSSTHSAARDVPNTTEDSRQGQEVSDVSKET